MKLLRTLLLSISLFGALASAHATPTENNVLHIVPAPGPVKMDGSLTGWDLSGSLFACDDVERFRDMYSVWFTAMYDQEFLYLMAQFKDSEPLNNNQSSKGGYGFAGDSLQVRFIAGYKTPEERVSHWTCWQDRDGINIMDVAYNRDIKGDKIANAEDQGAKQVFKKDADGKGYVQQLAIPWKLLTANGKAPAAGESFRMAIEPNFTAGPWGRINIHDIFREGVVPDRVFTFRAYDQWGTGLFEAKSLAALPPIRLGDEREFVAKSGTEGLTADWTGLVQKRELPGFKPVTFTTPADSFVSLNIKNAQDEVVRQLLTETFFEAGKQEVKWDGLTTPSYKTPGDVLPAGNYSWDAIAHPAFKLTLRGWASNAGATPWENGPKTHWGADHGVPDAVTTDGEKMYLGWSASEAGKSLLGTDLEGNVIWKIGTGLGFASEFLAVENGILYSLGKGELIRLRTTDGVFDNWKNRATAAIEIPELWAGQSTTEAWPERAGGMDVKDGQLYLSFSDQKFHDGNVANWRGLVTQLMTEDPISQRIFKSIDSRTTQKLKDFLADKKTKEQAFPTWAGGPKFDVEVVKTLNALLTATDLAPGTGKLTAIERASTNRQFLEKAFAPNLKPSKTDFIAVIDATSGKLLQTIDVSFPGSLKATAPGQVAFISEGQSVLSLDVKSGKVMPVISGLKDASALTFNDGKFYVAQKGDSQNVKVFSAAGQPAGTIGRDGGRQLIGTWQADGMYEPTALVVDKLSRLWVAEADNHPKRFSVWDLATGKLVKDFFGATHYGASGGAINPLDPNIMVGAGAEWKLDPATGRAICTGVFDREEHGFATFCAAPNNRLYVAVVYEIMHGSGGVRIFERVAEGDYKLRAEWRPDFVAQTTNVWSDINGDGKQDEGESKTLPFLIRLHGSNQWSLNMNPADFTLFGGVQSDKAVQSLSATAQRAAVSSVKLTQTVFDKVYRINPNGFTKCGAPTWDLDKLVDLPYVSSTALQSGSFGMLPSKDNRLLLACEKENFRCYDLIAGKQLWSYPNPFFQVHGSHLAPPPVPGVTRGAFGMVGIFNTPETGTVWAINGNCGEWYLLNEKGFYLGHLFEGDAMKMHYPDTGKPGVDMTEAPPGAGGEDFGGSLTQGVDGKVYIQAGKTAFWNIEATGFDKVASIGSGKLEIKPDEVELARLQKEAQMQVAAGRKQIDTKKLTPTFTGNLGKDFPGLALTSYQKGEDSAVRSVTAWDDQNLYLAWDVTDATPWTNAATEAAQMYNSGDSVDFQLGTNAKADGKRAEAVEGDLRISIGNFQGTPTAVLYRKESATKKKKTFSSGVIARYEMDYVDVIADAKIQVTPRPDKKGYVVEASIPLASLGFTPEPNLKYRADIGVTHGNEAGSRTRLRTYLTNQETGLVDDVVFELKMVPKNWGDIVFQK